MSEPTLTCKEEYEIAFTLKASASLQFGYAGCGTHEVIIRGTMDLNEAKRLHDYLGRLPGMENK